MCMKVWGVQRDPCLPPTGFTQLLVTYVHGAFPHLFASQAEARKDMLKRKRSQERFAKADCSSCFPTSSWRQQQLRGGGGGGVPKEKPNQLIIACPAINLRVYRVETEVTSSLRKFSFLSDVPMSPSRGGGSLPSPRPGAAAGIAASALSGLHRLRPAPVPSGQPEPRQGGAESGPVSGRWRKAGHRHSHS